MSNRSKSNFVDKPMKGEALNGDHYLIQAVVGNEIWNRWGISLALPTMTYDLQTHKGQMVWQLRDSQSSSVLERANETEFILLHPFVSGTGLIAEYEYNQTTNCLSVRFWFVSPEEKDLMWRNEAKVVSHV